MAVWAGDTGAKDYLAHSMTADGVECGDLASGRDHDSSASTRRKVEAKRAVLTTATVSPAAIGDALRSTGYLPSEGLSTSRLSRHGDESTALLLEGEPGTGKTSLARGVGDRYGCGADPFAVL